MTPFAAEVSRNFSRYMRNKIRLNDKMEELNILRSIINYFAELYPNRVYCADNALYVARLDNTKIDEIVPVLFSCYIVHEEEKTIQIKGQGDSEVAKLLKENTVITIKKIQAEITAITINVKNASPINQKHALVDKIIELQRLIHEHKNIFNGFVCFLTNEKELYPCGSKPLSTDMPENIAILHDVQFNQLTLFPALEIEGNKIAPFQAVWLPTRHKHFNFCMGMQDETLKINECPCTIPKSINAHNFDVSTLKRMQGKCNPNPEELDPKERFYEMLKGERFIKNTKGKDWLWEWETEFLNDYSRLMMSPAIRRMKDKTQVFSFEDSDFHRVRLTHSLEVANVARLIGIGVNHMLKNGVECVSMEGKKKYIKYEDIDEMHIPQILEVAGLVHDIGNPPFGHFGERTIQEFFKKSEIMSPKVRKEFENLSEQEKCDFINFDGNVQGFRILRHLGLSTDCSSFNLNKAIISTLVKYPYSSIEGNRRNDRDCRKHKFGFFVREEDAYNQMRETLCLEKGQRHPLAYLLEAADDICYMGSDIEDGWKLGYILADRITQAYAEVLSKNELKEIFKNDWQELCERIEHPDKIISANAIQSLRIRMQRYMVKEVVEYFCKNIERIVTNSLCDNEHELLMNIPIVKKLHCIWEQLVQDCYTKIHGAQIQGGQIITALLKCYTDIVFSDDSELLKYKEKKSCVKGINAKILIMKLNTDTKSGMIYETISDNFRYESSPVGQYVPQSSYEKFMLVTDYISGMTDCFATNRYEELMIK